MYVRTYVRVCVCVRMYVRTYVQLRMYISAYVIKNKNNLKLFNLIRTLLLPPSIPVARSCFVTAIVSPPLSWLCRPGIDPILTVQSPLTFNF